MLHSWDEARLCFFCHEALYSMKPWLNVEVAWDIATRIIAINRLDISIPSHPYSFSSLLLIPLPLLLLLKELLQGSTKNHIPHVTQPKSKLPPPRMFYWISFQTSYVIYKNDHMWLWDQTTCPFSPVSCLWQETVESSSGTSCSRQNSAHLP